ncbi:unnamed protein product, partial [Dovyalis caffra]
VVSIAKEKILDGSNLICVAKNKYSECGRRVLDVHTVMLVRPQPNMEMGLSNCAGASFSNNCIKCMLGGTKPYKWKGSFSNGKQLTHLAQNLSDHSSLLAQLVQHPSGSKLFKFHKMWMDHAYFDGFLNS